MESGAIDGVALFRKSLEDEIAEQKTKLDQCKLRRELHHTAEDTWETLIKKSLAADDDTDRKEFLKEKHDAGVRLQRNGSDIRACESRLRILHLALNELENQERK